MAEPSLGPVNIPLRLTPGLVHPPLWSERIEIRPITEDTICTVEIQDKLVLTPSHPVDSIWVGVSSADDQSYVQDQFAPRGNRPGNESAIVPILCTGRYSARLELVVPPPLEPVPVFVTPESTGRPINFSIDLSPYLPRIPEIGLNDLVRPERVSADIVFQSYYVSNNKVMARVIDKRGSNEIDSEVIIPNSEDRAKVISALNGARTDKLEDRFVVFLAGSHPYSNRLFEPAVESPMILAPFLDTLPPKAGRYVYRIRKADAAGNLSAGAAVAKIIVRIPSLAPGAAPEKLQSQPNDSAGTLRLKIAPETELTHLLLFTQAVSPSVIGPLGNVELLRVPNAYNLYPNHGILLRIPDGTLLNPIVKSLSDQDVLIDQYKFRLITLQLTTDLGKRLRIWACTLTKDGIPSLLGGAWSMAMPLPPLPTPELHVIAIPPTNLVFSWSWPIGESYEVVLEASDEGTSWERVSPPIAASATSYLYNTQPIGNWRYRLRILSLDVRSGYSNIVLPGEG